MRMRFTDNTILLSLVKYSESTAICRMFGRDYGLISGAVRGALSSKRAGDFQPGNLFQVEWSARLPQQLGSLKAEMTAPAAAYFMNDALKISALNSLMVLTQAALPEHDPHPRLFDALASLLDKMRHHAPDWLADVARYELLLLAETGFQLELDKCTVTGCRDDLRYVSPKSGCAVSADAGAPYRHKLLPLPEFLLNQSRSPNPEALREALTLTGYFLEHRLFSSHHQPLPATRKRFAENVNKLLQSAVEAAKQAV